MMLSIWDLELQKPKKPKLDQLFEEASKGEMTKYSSAYDIKVETFYVQALSEK